LCCILCVHPLPHNHLRAIGVFINQLLHQVICGSHLHSLTPSSFLFCPSRFHICGFRLHSHRENITIPLSHYSVASHGFKGRHHRLHLITIVHVPSVHLKKKIDIEAMRVVSLKIRCHEKERRWALMKGPQSPNNSSRINPSTTE
jgi:hypothetical protein